MAKWIWRPFGRCCRSGARRFGAAGTLAARVEGFEKEIILAELKHNAYNMTETARALGLERSHLYKKCTQLGIEVEKLRTSAL